MSKTYYDGHVRALADRLRAAREKTGLSGRGAATVLGVHPERLNSLETARIEPKARDVALYARLTGVDAAELLMGEDCELIAIPDDPTLYRRPQGETTRTANRVKRQDEQGRAPRLRPGPTWRPAGIGRDLRPTVKGEDL